MHNQSWMISLGQTLPPKHWYVDRNEPEYKEPKVRPSRGGEGFNWNPIKRGLSRLEKVIEIILKGGGRITAESAYHYIIERNPKLMPRNVYGKRMSEKRFYYYFHKIRKTMNVESARSYKIDFIRENYLIFTQSEMAICLETKEEYVKQTIRRMNKKGIK